MKKDKSKEFANVNFSLFVWVSGLQIATARIAIRRRSIQNVYSVYDAGKEIYLVKINPHTKMSST